MRVLRGSSAAVPVPNQKGIDVYSWMSEMDSPSGSMGMCNDGPCSAGAEKRVPAEGTGRPGGEALDHSGCVD